MKVPFFMRKKLENNHEEIKVFDNNSDNFNVENINKKKLIASLDEDKINNLFFRYNLNEDMISMFFWKL